ncbi:MAG: hypothetical protein U5L04_11885 [Trueperaceae bacterium]|nr:hypothetical protein [Trueperaceae bacterium]
MEPKFKLITSNDLDIFQDRLNAFIGSLGNDDIIVDVKFSTTGAGGGVEFSALVHYQETEAWGE